jgi:ABC-type branched-subunit amino acid transport system ATPase component
MSRGEVVLEGEPDELGDGRSIQDAYLGTGTRQAG